MNLPESSTQENKSADKNSYLYRYLKQARRFELTGAVFMIITILINELTGGTYHTPVLICAAFAAIPLLIGGIAAQPHNIIKSFAELLQKDPTKRNAQEFIKALTYRKKVSLTKRSLNLCEAAAFCYKNSSEYDESVHHDLLDAIHSHVKVILF